MEQKKEEQSRQPEQPKQEERPYLEFRGSSEQLFEICTNVNGDSSKLLRVIFVCGDVGAGKTTLINKWTEAHPEILTTAEKWTEGNGTFQKLFALYNKNPALYGVEFQAKVQLSFLESYRRALEEAVPGQVLVVERVITEEALFSTTLFHQKQIDEFSFRYLLGMNETLSRAEKKLEDAWRKKYDEASIACSLVFLDIPLKVREERINKRCGQDELALRLSQLQTLAIGYQRWWPNEISYLESRYEGYLPVLVQEVILDISPISLGYEEIPSP
jgi:deoxyadenosine/deoxycytidine kinase